MTKKIALLLALALLLGGGWWYHTTHEKPSCTSAKDPSLTARENCLEQVYTWCDKHQPDNTACPLNLYGKD
jgi:hypothetical protein